MIKHAEPLTIFLSYAHEDKEPLEELKKQLNSLQMQKPVFLWDDQQIEPGANSVQAVDKQLEKASIILLLISPDHSYSVEMDRALGRHNQGEAQVIPIILRSIDWEHTPLGTLQALPRDGCPVLKWEKEDRDKVWKQIAAEIRMVVERLLRPVVVLSSLQQQDVAERLVSLLEAQRVPITYAEHVSEATELQEAIRESSAVVLISSAETHSTHPLKKIRELAIAYQRPVFVVWIAGNDQCKEQNTPPEAWYTSIYIDSAPECQDMAFQDLLHRLKLLRHSTSQNASIPPSEPRNPYKGLRSFTSDDTSDFFGRSALIDELARSVEHMLTLDKQGKHHARILAVVGPSGSGKSSVVMAGLLPCLRNGEVFDSDTWIYLDPLVPGEHPIEALALALFEHFPEKNLQMLCDDLQHEAAHGLHLYATALARRAKSPYVMLVVDQFEELFTLTTSEQERQQFIHLLATACMQREGSLIVILTLRADFYDRPMQYPPLYALIEKHQTALLPMTQEDLRAVITQPAALPDVQVTFEGNLVNDLLFDVQGQVGALPLLQFTLDQLFEQREGHVLTLQAYHENGGVRGALSRHAEQTYQRLPSQQHQALARALFLRLIEPGITEQDTTRRRAALSELALTDASEKQHMQETLETFIKARLLTTNQRQGTTIVEVSHEAVIREWKLLAEWLSEAREDIHFQQALSEDVAEWEQRKRPKDRLYRGAQLQEAKSWASRNKPSEQETDFLQASVRQRTLSLVSWVVIALVLVSSIGAAGWYAALNQAIHPDPTLVTTLQDNVNGSLRYCIENAPTGSTIRFAQGLHGTIELKESLSFLSGKQLTIQSPGRDQLTVSGASHSYANILVPPGATLNVADLSFKNSQTVSDAFLYNEGILTVKNSIVSNNETLTGVTAFGGGIYNTGTLTLISSVLSGNTAMSHTGSVGGGIDNEGTLTVIDSTFFNNTASCSSDISGDSCSSFGGGIRNRGGTLTVIDSTFFNNTANSSGSNAASVGGGIDNDGTATVSNSTFSENGANSSNGGISSGGGINNFGTLTMTDSTFFNNTASSSGSNGFSSGGGIDNSDTAMVSNSTFSENGANSSGDSRGGGITNSRGKLIVINSTLSNNTVSSSGSSNDFSSGGGIDILEGSSSVIRFCTIYGNVAGIGGGISSDPDDSSILTIGSTIVAANKALNRTLIIINAPDISGALTSDGYNLIENGAGITKVNPMATDGRVTVADLKLDAVLRNNGGSTQTLNLLPGSPAIDAVPENACKITFTDASGHTETITTDQRGNSRPDGSEDACDIGAYESSY